MKQRRLTYSITIGLILTLIAATVALASSVDVAVVDVTAPTGSVILNPGGSGGSININMKHVPFQAK